MSKQFLAAALALGIAAPAAPADTSSAGNAASRTTPELGTAEIIRFLQRNSRRN